MGKWHDPNDSLPSLFLKPFLVCCCLRPLRSQVVQVVLGPKSSPKPCCMPSRSAGDLPLWKPRGHTVLQPWYWISWLYEPGCVQTSCSVHLSGMLLCPELDEEAFPWEAETSAAKFSWNPVVEPYLQPQQKLRDFQAGYVQLAVMLEDRLESATAGGCPPFTCLLAAQPCKASPVSQATLDCIWTLQKQGAVSLKEKAEKKSKPLAHGPPCAFCWTETAP